MAEDERKNLRHMINQTIERLKRSSVGANNMGTRYSRLLQLLWRKSPKITSTSNNISSRDLGTPTSMHGHTKSSSMSQNAVSQTENFENGRYGASMVMPALGENQYPEVPAPTGTFSWLDLDATWSFATQNNNSISGGSAGEFDDERIMGDYGLSPFDMGLLADYTLLNEENTGLIF